MSQRALTVAEAERVLRALQRRAEKKHGGDMQALAAELGLWEPELRQPIYGTAEALAHAEGITVETVINATKDRAAAYAREGGIPEAAIHAVLAEPEPEGLEKTVVWWMDRMRLAARKLQN